jgi:carbonic anhydrase
MSVIDDLIENARRYAIDPAGYHATEKSAKPGRHLAIVACMDARLRLFSLLGLDEGDAHIIRNAGGVVTDDVIRSVAVSQHLLETIDVMVIQHTDCGLTRSTDAGFDELMQEHAGHRPTWGLRAIDDLESNVRGSVNALIASPFLVNRGEVRGFVFDVTDGSLREIT